MVSDGLVTGVGALAKHKVAGSTPVTRSQNFTALAPSSRSMKPLGCDRRSAWIFRSSYERSLNQVPPGGMTRPARETTLLGEKIRAAAALSGPHCEELPLNLQVVDFSVPAASRPVQ